MQLIREKQFYKHITVLAAPIVLQNIITYSVTLADNVMVGSLGTSSLSGVYMANQVMNLLQMLVTGLSAAMVVLATQYWGKKDTASIKSIVGIALKMVVSLSMLLWIAVLLWPEALLRIFTDSEPVIACGKEYLSIVCYSYLFFGLTNVLISSMRCVENVKIGMYVSMAALLTNVSLNYVLIFGHFGAPRLGLSGAAIATLISRIVEFSIILFYVAKKDQKLHIHVKELWHSSPGLLRDFFKYGVPVIAGSLLWGLNGSYQSAIIGRLSAAAISAVSISNTVYQLTSVAIFGIREASSIIVGKAVGTNNFDLVKRYAVTFQVMFLGVGLITGLLIFSLRDIILLLYSNLDAETIIVSRQLMTVLAITTVGTAYQMGTLTGVVRAGGATNFVLKNDTCFVVFVIIPASLLASYVFHAPAWVVYLCLKCDQLLKCIVAFIKVNRFNWVRNLTRERAVQAS